jgi:Tol biopolymer transport system component
LHRDLKPDNIFVLPGGHLKVLDFGLARMQAEAGGDDLTLTSPGMMMGTIPYMSPEQARGEVLDARSDIFSFGSVFYEMACGRAAFSARSAAETFAAVLHQQPSPPASVRAGVPPKVDEIAGRCLEKEPEMRYQSAADLRSELKRLSRGAGGDAARPADTAVMAAPAPRAPSVAASAPPAVAAPRRRGWLGPGLGLAATLVLGALGWWRFHAFPSSGPAPPPRLQFRQLTFTGQVVDAVISPDGKFLAHIDDGPQGTSLQLFSTVSGSDVTIVPPAPGCCQSPSVSPDGGEVYFVDARDLQVVPVLGGAPHIIATNVDSGAGFSPDGAQLAYLEGQNSATLMLAKPDGSGAHPLTHAASGGFSSLRYTPTAGAPAHAPQWSPDGRWIALSWGPSAGNTHAVLVDTQTGRQRRLGPALFPTTADLNWLPDGSGLITTASLPQTAAPQVYELTYPGGQLRQLTDDLQGYSGSSLASTGQLALVHAVPQASLWVQRRPGGAIVQLPGGGTDLDGLQGVAWTHQGSLVDIRLPGGNPQIWAENSDGSGQRPILATGLPYLSYGLVAAPNGQLVFGDAESDSHVWRLNANGTGLTHLVQLPAGASALDPSIVLGGRAVAYLLAEANGSQTLCVTPLAGGKPHPVWDGNIYGSTNPASPDGTRVFAVSYGPRFKNQALVLRVDGQRPRVTPVAGFDRAVMQLPFAWTPDGAGISYVRHQGNVDNLWVLPLAGGRARELTHFRDLQINHYAFAPDGRLAISRGSPGSDAVLATGLGHPRR